MKGTEIRNKLHGFGTAADEAYTNQEIVDHLKELQSAIAHEVCGNDGESLVRADAIIREVEDRVVGLGIQDSDAFLTFKRDMHDLGKEIALTISGINGEMKGFRALKPLEFDTDTHVLRNVCLKSEAGETEIDALVIAPYGIFVIEMKGCRKPVMITEDGFFQKVDNPDYQYPLGERMCCKESLLREALAKDPRVPVRPVLFLVNDSDLTDHFGKIMTTNRNTIVYKIRSYSSEAAHLSKEQVDALVERVEASHHDAKYPCSLDCNRIVENLAVLMDQIEAAEQAKSESAQDRKLNTGAKQRVLQAVATGFAAGIAGCAVAVFKPFATRAIKASR